MVVTPHLHSHYPIFWLSPDRLGEKKKKRKRPLPASPVQGFYYMLSIYIPGFWPLRFHFLTDIARVSMRQWLRFARLVGLFNFSQGLFTGLFWHPFDTRVPQGPGTMIVTMANPSNLVSKDLVKAPHSYETIVHHAGDQVQLVSKETYTSVKRDLPLCIMPETRYN